MLLVIKDNFSYLENSEFNKSLRRVKENYLKDYNKFRLKK